MINKKFAVIGLGRFGLKLVEELTKMGLEVLAIDNDNSAVEKVRDLASESPARAPRADRAFGGRPCKGRAACPHRSQPRHPCLHCRCRPRNPTL